MPTPRARVARLATFRRKIDVFGILVNRAPQSKRHRNGGQGLEDASSSAQTYGTDCFAIARPMLMRLSAITPRPTQRFIPSLPLYRQRSRPCRRLVTLMRPSHPVRHFWPLRNQRFFCSRLRSGLLVERLGMQTRLTPLVFAVAWF